jgi:hypothetical protein
MQRWDTDGTFVALRNPKNQRYYTEDQIQQFTHPEISNNVSDIIKAIKNRYEMLEATNRLDDENLRVHIFADLFYPNMGYEFDYQDMFFISYASRENCIDSTVFQKVKRNNVGLLFVTFSDKTEDGFFYNETKIQMRKIECNKGIIVNKRKWTAIINDEIFELDFSKEVDETTFSKLYFKMAAR